MFRHNQSKHAVLEIFKGANEWRCHPLVDHLVEVGCDLHSNTRVLARGFAKLPFPVIASSEIGVIGRDGALQA